MNYEPTLPPAMALLASLPERYRIAQDRLLDLENAGALDAIADLAFVRRLIDARRELDDPMNRRSPRCMQLALRRFDRELAAFQTEVERLEASLQGRRPV